MSATVTTLAPAAPNLDNVPHMLRTWAEAIEAGQLPGDTVVCVAVDRSCWEKPAILVAGQNLSPLELAGVGQFIGARAQGVL